MGLYVTNSLGDDITVIDLATLRVVDDIKVGKHVHGIAAPTDGRRLFVTIESERNLKVIDTATDQVTDIILSPAGRTYAHRPPTADSWPCPSATATVWTSLMQPSTRLYGFSPSGCRVPTFLRPVPRGYREGQPSLTRPRPLSGKPSACARLSARSVDCLNPGLIRCWAARNIL
jgi:YVTN family beta-propeller protein